MLRAVLRWAMRNSIDAELAGLSEWVRHGLHASDTVGGAAGTMLLSQSTALRDLYEAPPPAVSVAEQAAERAASAARGSLLKEVAERAAMYGRGVRPADGAAAAAMECQQEREAERQEENEAVREVSLSSEPERGASCLFPTLLPLVRTQIQHARCTPRAETTFPCNTLLGGWQAVRPECDALPLGTAVAELFSDASLATIAWSACSRGGAEGRGGVVELFATRNFVSPLDGASAVGAQVMRLRSVGALLVFAARSPDDSSAVLLLSDREADAVLGALRLLPADRRAAAPALLHLAYARGIGCSTGLHPAPPPLRFVTGGDVSAAAAVLSHDVLVRLQAFNGETTFALGTPEETGVGSGARGELPALRGGALERWRALVSLLQPLPALARGAGTVPAVQRGSHDVERSDLDCAVKGLRKYAEAE